MVCIEGDRKDHLVPTPVSPEGLPATKSGTRSDCPGPYPTPLNTSRHGVCTAFLSNLFMLRFWAEAEFFSIGKFTYHLGFAVLCVSTKLTIIILFLLACSAHCSGLFCDKVPA